MEESLVASVSRISKCFFLTQVGSQPSLYCEEKNAIPSLTSGCALFVVVFFLQVALPHSLPLPRRETLQQSSSLSTVSPATVDLTLKVHAHTYTHTHTQLSTFCWISVF